MVGATNISLQAQRGDGVALFDALRARAWRGKLEYFAANLGVRPLLVHVPNASWCGRYAANEDAFEAVVAELRAIAD